MQGIQTARSPFQIAAESYEYSFRTPALSAVMETEAAVHTLPTLPDWAPIRQSRRVPVIVRINRLLRTLLVTFCGLSLLGYGLDVAASSEVGKLQGQARRLSEQNTELSAQLLRAISFQGIQANVVGRAGLRVPEHVLIIKEVQPNSVPAFQPTKYYLPLMSGY